MMTLITQLRKNAIRNRESHPSSFREPNLDFRNLLVKLEEAEIDIKLEKKYKISICQRHPNHYFPDESYT